MKKVIVTLAVVIMALGLSTQNLKAQENNNGQNPAESGYNIGLGFHLSMDLFNPNKDLNSQLGIKTKGIGYGAGFSIFLAHQNFKAYFGFDFNHSSNFLQLVLFLRFGQT